MTRGFVSVSQALHVSVGGRARSVEHLQQARCTECGLDGGQRVSFLRSAVQMMDDSARAVAGP